MENDSGVNIGITMGCFGWSLLGFGYIQTIVIRLQSILDNENEKSKLKFLLFAPYIVFMGTILPSIIVDTSLKSLCHLCVILFSITIDCYTQMKFLKFRKHQNQTVQIVIKYGGISVTCNMINLIYLFVSAFGANIKRQFFFNMGGTLISDIMWLLLVVMHIKIHKMSKHANLHQSSLVVKTQNQLAVKEEPISVTVGDSELTR